MLCIKTEPQKAIHQESDANLYCQLWSLRSRQVSINSLKHWIPLHTHSTGAGLYHMITVLWADNPEDSQVAGTTHPWKPVVNVKIVQIDRKHLITCQPEHEQSFVSRLAARSDECRRSLQSPTFFPSVKRYTRMLPINDGLVASFGRRWTVKTPQRHLANRNNNFVLCDDYPKNHLAEWFFSAGDGSKSGWLLQDGYGQPKYKKDDAFYMQPKADDEFIQTWRFRQYRTWITGIRGFSDYNGFRIYFLESDSPLKATPLRFRIQPEAVIGVIYGYSACFDGKPS